MTSTIGPLLENCCGCNKCPDDGDILNVEILSADECGGGCNGCCGSKCNDNCGINIQSTNDCLTVDTSECGVVKITSHCPPIVTAGDNITVDVEPCDQENCSLNYIVSADCADEKVKACGGDSTPGTLIDKLAAGTGIHIDPIGCDGSNSKLKISIDESILPDCPDVPRITIIDKSNLIDATVSGADGHTITISDADGKAYYAKLVLADNHIWTAATGNIGIWEEYLGQKAPVSWKPVRPSGGEINTRNSLRKGLEFFEGTDAAPGYGWIKITKRGLYQVGFTGSAEFSYGVHAFRVQLYRIPNNDYTKRNTIVESRYSGPLGYEPRQPVMQGAGNIKYQDRNGNDREFHIDYPLIGEKTEVEGQAGTGYSASLGAVMDRVTVTGNTIIELDVGDLMYVGLKMSTSITHSGSMMANIPASFLTGHIALLGADVESGDNGPEAGFSFYANLIHPLNAT